MIIGFTGTRNGMTENQKKEVRKIVHENKESEFHHGDCLGSDAEFHDIVSEISENIVIHPPINPELRAFKESKKILKEKPYLRRDRDIADICDLLIGCPAAHTVSGGTWYTIRYARMIGKKVMIIQP